MQKKFVCDRSLLSNVMDSARIEIAGYLDRKAAKTRLELNRE